MRIPRKYIETSFFHIMVQGINKEYIFNSHEDKNKYIEMMGVSKYKYDISILEYCIMNNHAHLIIYTEDMSELSKFMHKVNQKYAMYYNKKNQRVGYVFRNRYQLQQIKDEGHLITCIKYIYENPVKAKICKTSGEYLYSSYKNKKIVDESILKQVCNIDVNSIKRANYKFLEDDSDKGKSCDELIKNIINANNIEIEELKFHRELLEEIAIKMRNDYGMSYRDMEKKLKVGRETLRKLLK